MSSVGILLLGHKVPDTHGWRRLARGRAMTSPPSLPREEAEAAASKENVAHHPLPAPAPLSNVVRLFVGDLSPATTQQSLCDYFS